MKNPNRFLWIAFGVFATVGIQSSLCCMCCGQQEKEQQNKPSDPTSEFKKIISSGGQKQLSENIRKLTLKYIPKDYVDQKKWGMKKQFTKYLPKKRKVMLNHGRWRKYVVTFVEPKKNLKIHISEIQVSPSKTSFRLKIRTKFDLMARQSKWIRGLQLYSIHADCSADCELDLLCHVGIKWDLFSKQKSLSLTPTIITAKTMIHDFRIHRISNVGGEVAQQLTKAAKKWLEDHQAEYDKKIKDKLNKMIQKKKERLTLKW